MRRITDLRWMLAVWIAVTQIMPFGIDANDWLAEIKQFGSYNKTREGIKRVRQKQTDHTGFHRA